MAGMRGRVLPQIHYDMTGLGSLGVATIVIARKIDTSRWREGVVLARLHAATWSGGAQPCQFSLILAPDGYTDEDPLEIWNFATQTLVTFSAAADTAPAVKNASFTTPFGPLAQLRLQFTQNGTAGTTFKPSISVDLNLKGE